MTDEDLLKRIDNACDNMYKCGKIPSRNIPARPNDDFDLLLGELILRFLERPKIVTPTTELIAE